MYQPQSCQTFSYFWFISALIFIRKQGKVPHQLQSVRYLGLMVVLHRVLFFHLLLVQSLYLVLWRWILLCYDNPLTSIHLSAKNSLLTMLICGHTGLWFFRVRLEVKRCGWVPWSADFRSKYYDGYGFTWCQHRWFFRSWICSDAIWKGPTPPLSCPQEAWSTTFPAWFFLVNRGKYHHLKRIHKSPILLKSLVTLSSGSLSPLKCSKR